LADLNIIKSFTNASVKNNNNNKKKKGRQVDIALLNIRCGVSHYYGCVEFEYKDKSLPIYEK